MNIALLEPLGIPGKTIDELAAPLKAAGHEFVYFDTKTTDADELTRRSAGAEIVMIANNPYPAEVIEASDALKMIAVAFTGIDHVALDACRARGIEVRNCAGYSDISVAELALGLTIDVLRKVVAADGAVRKGETSAGLMGTEIFGKTVGIIGCGKIGCATGRLFRALGARVLGYSRHEHPEAAAAGIEQVPLDTLLNQADIVSLHLPSNESTRKSFSAGQISQMKDGAILINCARGAIVDNDALADALNAGKLAGAGIDVFDMEPPIPADYPLVNAANCVFTPHVAFLTRESMERRAIIEFENVLAYTEGRSQNICQL
ncbi:2-hydroxyacid dehydrogenase [Collinsella phocaeensis]|uniref:2-hydroxyacid dehydrogenase n=1 Tax=Collinsella phocaeensis TaxID=1871016 RepID=UPI0009303D81|nr:2-hydroxyacid dehydrogenase [Collinsella phocaeensis]